MMFHMSYKALTLGALSVLLILEQVIPSAAESLRISNKRDLESCKYKVELRALSSKPSAVTIKLFTTNEGEYSDALDIGTDFDSHYLDFEGNCGNVEAVEVIQSSESLTEIRAVKVHKDGQYVFGNYCFSKASCGNLRLTQKDRCGEASAGGIKLGQGDKVKSFRDGSDECFGGPCDEDERANVKAENKCFDLFLTSNMAEDDDASDTCQAMPIVCKDSDPNTQASCDPEIGCVFTCESTHLCTKKFYADDGKCMAEPVVCDDSDPNTVDTCDPEKGCVHSCASDDLCKVPFLDDDMKCQFKDIVCDDGNPETTDSCDPNIGCVRKCGNDNNACTMESFDDDGKCISTPVTCDDGDPTTLDICDPTSGCNFLPLNENLEFEISQLYADPEDENKTIYVHEDQPTDTLSPEDEKAILLWIKTEVWQKRTPFCWRRSYGRGVGKPPTECRNGKEKVGALCYSKCPNGYSRQGTLDCQQKCKEGWRDDGLFCRLAEYGRGAGFPWKFGDGFNDRGMKKRCEKKQGKGNCEKSGAIFYPKCKPGYKARGCCICAPRSFDCEAEGYAGEFAGSCAVKIKSGDPTPLKCKPGMDEDAGLCYKKCKSKFDGVGPVCWQECVKDQVDCGFGCANSTKTCINEITDQVLAPLIAAANVATNLAKMGLLPTSVATATKEAFEWGVQLSGKFYTLLDGTNTDVGRALLQVADKFQNVDPDYIGSIGEGLDKSTALATFVDSLREGADEVLTRVVKPHTDSSLDLYASIRRYESNFVEFFAELTSPEIETQIDEKLSEVDAYRIKQLWADVQYEEIAKEEKWNTTYNEVLYWADIVDDHVSGILGFEIKEVVSAYLKPICHEIHPFPELKRKAVSEE